MLYACTQGCTVYHTTAHFPRREDSKIQHDLLQALTSSLANCEPRALLYPKKRTHLPMSPGWFYPLPTHQFSSNGIREGVQYRRSLGATRNETKPQTRQLDQTFDQTLDQTFDQPSTRPWTRPSTKVYPRPAARPDMKPELKPDLKPDLQTP